MAKPIRNDDTGVELKPAMKQRRFPWRLWLWAIVMTAAAGAGGYFAWFYRDAASTEKGRAEAATATGEAATKTLGEQQATLDDCVKKRDELQASSKQLTDNLATLTKDGKLKAEELEQLRVQSEEAKKRLESFNTIRTQFAKMIDTGTLKVTSRRGSLVLSLPAEVLFPSGVAELSEDGEIKVLEVGVLLKQFTDRRFLVIGHSDNQPLKSSTFKDNWELSTARALTVTRFLVKAGMKPENLLPAGSGEHDPIASNSSAKDLARNRRIEIALMPAINELPPLPELDPAKAEPAKK